MWLVYTETPDNLKMVRHYHLIDLTYTGSPESIITEAKFNPDRKLMMIMNHDKLVGFFWLHLHDGHFDIDILIRALSIDEKYRHSEFMVN